MSTSKVSTETIEGTQIEITVDLETGQFQTYLSGEWWKADSLKKLRDKLRAHLRQQAVAIPATLIDGEEDDRIKITPITITGQHAGNQNWLYTERNGDRGQHRWGTIYRGLVGPEYAEVVRLHKEYNAARNRLREHLEALELNVHEAYAEARKQSAAPAAQVEEPKHRTRTHPDMDALNEEIIG